MSYINIIRSVVAAVLLIFLLDFEPLQIGLNGERRSRVTNGAPVRGRKRTSTPDPDPMSYLRKYGYLPRSDQETQALRTDDEQREAIRRFQRMAGIRETGMVDDETKDAMRRQRCGMPDVAPAEFKLGPSRWDKNQLTYRILSYTSDVRQASVDDDVRRAMDAWSEVTPLTFRQIYSGDADILISFQRLLHNDGYAFDGKGGVLAHAFPPGAGRGGDVHFDDDETWTVDSTEGVNLFIVSAHELGHSLGLLHSEYQSALMYPIYQGYQPSFRLSSDDIAGMQSIYGSRSGETMSPRYPPRTVQPGPSPRSSTQRPRVTEPTPSDVSDLCNARLDSVARIRGEIFAFSDKWFWRLMKDDVRPAERSVISSFWRGLPVDLVRIDAVVERASDGIIFFFLGDKYWAFNGNELSSGFPSAGRSITDFGIPNVIDHIDAAFDWEMNGHVYLVSGDMYWRLMSSGTKTETGYPLAMDMWEGIPATINAAFTHFDGLTYFIKGQDFWRLEKGQMQSSYGSPETTSSLWTQCKNAASMPSVNLAPSRGLLCLLAYALLTLSLT